VKFRLFEAIKLNLKFVSLLFVAAGFSVPASAQQRSSAAVYGTVSDSQGAVTPGAAVTLLQTETGQSRNTTTNGEGGFQFPLLPVGPYEVTVQHAGFKRYEQKGLLLQVNDNIKIDVHLELGEVSTTVAVEASGVSVTTDSATIKEVVDSRRVVDLPLNGRNLADLTLLVPGVQPATNSANGDAGLNAYSAPGVKALSVNGSRQNQLKFTLDGGDNSDPLFNTNMAFPFPIPWKSSASSPVTPVWKSARVPQELSTW
jgi:hypothetical protein